MRRENPYPGGLAAAREVRRAQINQLAAEKFDAGVAYKNTTFKIDQPNQLNVLGTRVKIDGGAVNPHGGTWRDKDETDIALTDAEFVEFSDLVFERSKAIVRAAHAHKDQVYKVLGTVREVLSYDITGGWPA